MPATFDYRNPANTYTQDVSGGTVSTAEHKDLVVEWVKAIEPWQTEVLDKIMSNEEFDQEVLQWGQSVRIDFDTHLNGGINNSTTTINVAAGTGVILQVYGVYAIFDYKTGSTTEIDESTQENVWVTAVTTDAATVTRAYGGTAVAHLDGAVFMFIGTSEPLNGIHTEAPRRLGFRSSNYPQRFEAQLTADLREQNMSTWEYESNPLLEQFNAEILKQKKLLQRAFFYGKKRAGTPTVPSAMGGINEFLTTNTIDLTGQLLTADLLDNALQNIWETTDSSQQKTIVTSYQTKRLLDTYLNPHRRATMQDTTVNKTVQEYTFNTGTFPVMPMRDVPEGNVYLLDWSLIAMRPFKGANWHKSQRKGLDHGVDHDVFAISGDFTLEVKTEKAMARLHNFIGDLNQYPQLTQY